MAAEKIGEKQSRDGGSVLSGDAFKQGIGTATYADNFFDIGFMPEQIYIENAGSTDLEIKFLHQTLNAQGQFVEPSVPSDAVNPSSLLPGNTSKVWRRRNHRYVAIKGISAFIIEAW